MKKLFLLLITVLATSDLVLGQSGDPLLYKISGNGLEKPSYLFGTIHLMCEEDFELQASVKSAFAEVDQFVLELDMDDPSMMMKMQQTMMMKDGLSINELVDEDEYELLKTYFKENVKIPLAMVGKVKPFALTSMIYPSLLGCPIKSYELTLVENAKASKKEVLGLETVEFQMGIFDELSYQEQADMLVEMVEKVDEAKGEFDKLVRTYKEGDPEALLAIMKRSSFEMSPEMMEKLIDERNQDWIDKIETMAQNTPSLFAVGAGHLGGENGVINLLRKQGFSVEKVK